MNYININPSTPSILTLITKEELEKLSKNKILEILD